jgi:hypothetical protein
VTPNRSKMWMLNLLDDANPFVRPKAMEAFRKTVGLGAVAGVNVNVNHKRRSLRMAIPLAGSNSF